MKSSWPIKLQLAELQLNIDDLVREFVDKCSENQDTKRNFLRTYGILRRQESLIMDGIEQEYELWDWDRAIEDGLLSKADKKDFNTKIKSWQKFKKEHEKNFKKHGET
jgi:hypothetical protein